MAVTELKKQSPKKQRPKKRRILRKKDEKVMEELSAGGIVFKRTPRGVRVALLKDPFGKWAFAKGHVEKGETIEEAAIRETREEMGLGRLRIVAPLGIINFWFRDRYREETKGVLVHKYVHYFLMEAPPSAKGRPQKKEKIHKIVWIGASQAVKQSSYKDVRPILKKMQEYFVEHRLVRKQRPNTPGGGSKKRQGQPPAKKDSQPRKKG